MERDGVERYRQASALLPLRWRRLAEALGAGEQEEAEEFRLRAGCPATVLLPEGEKPLDPGGGLVTAGELEQMCDRITEYSRYAASESMRQGFLTAQGGFRAGLCGTAVMQDGACVNLRDLSSITLRIQRQRVGVAEEVFSQTYGAAGRLTDVLLLSPPGAGKTTLLRDLIRLLSGGRAPLPPQRVAVADERGEIAAMHHGVAQMDLGEHTDVLDGCPKALAVPILLRACSPQVIAVDEITAEEDLRCMIGASNCGVSLLATIHAADLEELRRKPLFRLVEEAQVFRYAVTICCSGGERTYRVEEL